MATKGQQGLYFAASLWFLVNNVKLVQAAALWMAAEHKECAPSSGIAALQWEEL